MPRFENDDDVEVLNLGVQDDAQPDKDTDPDTDDDDRGDDHEPTGDDDEEVAGAGAEGAGEGDDEEADPMDPEVLRDIAGNGKKAPVPYTRFAEVIAQRDQAIAALMQVPGAIAATAAQPAAAPVKDPPPAYDFRAKMRERNKLILEGDEEGAAALDAEIHDKTFELAEARATATAQAHASAVIQQDRAEAAVAAVFHDYPFLSDADPATFNAEALADVMMYRERYIKEGLSIPEAIRKAADKVAPMYTEKAPDKKDATGKPPAKEPGAVRNARVAAAQPPKTHAVGTSSRRGQVAYTEGVGQMSDDEYQKMPEAERKRLRGDFVWQ